ncbi:MAG TPA: hypothetical protein VMW10_08430 [Alphaproteobacteria bacterium]|nr:hypothetical protein [Alphaproteobacteria bacterium]
MTRVLYMALVTGALMGSFSQANASCFSNTDSFYCGSPMYSGYQMYGGYPMFNGDTMYSTAPMYSEFAFSSGVIMVGVPFTLFNAIPNPIPVYMIDQYDVSLRHPESSIIG